MMRRHQISEAQVIAAEKAMHDLDPNDSDQEIARIVANYLQLPMRHSHAYHLKIIHDVRPSTVRRLEKIRKTWPSYEPADPTGPCPVVFDWQNKNTVGISTRDRERARQWIVDAMLAGYGVFRLFIPSQRRLRTRINRRNPPAAPTGRSNTSHHVA